MVESPYMDFIAIGDTTVDEFIRLKDSESNIHCDESGENCTISMKWGDKIPYEFAARVPGVGNAANAAVAAARLGLSTAFISSVGKDRNGDDCLATFRREGISTQYVTVREDIPTNCYYILWRGSERTILVHHQQHPWSIPSDLQSSKWVYFSSLSPHSEAFHDEFAAWVAAHPETKLAFQPGTFQMEMGRERLATLYATTELIACNKEEAERILGVEKTDIKELLKKMHGLGPKIVLITDGPNGAYAYDGTEMLTVPMYPDPKPAYDRTGAGDAMAATFVAALALGKSLREALLWGPINSMSVVQEIGAQKGLLTREALETFLANAPADYRVESF